MANGICWAVVVIVACLLGWDYLLMAGNRNKLLWSELRGLLMHVWQVCMCFHTYSHPAKHEFPALQRCSGRVSSPFTPFPGHAQVQCRLLQEVPGLCRGVLQSCQPLLKQSCRSP